MEQDKVSKLSDTEKNVWVEDGDKKGRGKQKRTMSYWQRWEQAQATKTMVFWIAIGVIILTLIVGFNWGGWVTGGTAQKMSDTAANDAVVQRLSSICVAQFDQDLGKVEKLRNLNSARAFERDDYVKEQGWATMPGEETPDSKVADACAKLLIAQ